MMVSTILCVTILRDIRPLRADAVQRTAREKQWLQQSPQDRTGTPACPLLVSCLSRPCSLCALSPLWLIVFDLIGVYRRSSAANSCSWFYPCSSVFICGSIIVLLGGLGVLGGSVLDLIPPLFLSACSAVHLSILFW